MVLIVIFPLSFLMMLHASTNFGCSKGSPPLRMSSLRGSGKSIWRKSSENALSISKGMALLPFFQIAVLAVQLAEVHDVQVKEVLRHRRSPFGCGYPRTCLVYPYYFLLYHINSSNNRLSRLFYVYINLPIFLYHHQPFLYVP